MSRSAQVAEFCPALSARPRATEKTSRPLPERIRIVVIALFYFGIKTWLNADNLPPPREQEPDDDHGHGHH